MKCNNCGKETKNLKFCSRSCAAQLNNKMFPKQKTKKKCIICNDPVKSYRHNRCEKHWNEYIESKSRDIRNRPLKEYWNKESLKNLHPSSKNSHIRGLVNVDFKHLKNEPCANCGYKKHVELCHIKPISEFDEDSTINEVNSKNNIIQLCPNCHWELDNGLLRLCTILDSNQ